MFAFSSMLIPSLHRVISLRFYFFCLGILLGALFGTHSLEIYEIVPTQGSIAGYTLVTFFGEELQFYNFSCVFGDQYGFPPGNATYIPCGKPNETYSLCTCLTPSMNAPQEVSVYLIDSNLGINITAPKLFQFGQPTPTSLSLTSVSFADASNINLTITGNYFNGGETVNGSIECVFVNTENPSITFSSVAKRVRRWQYQSIDTMALSKDRLCDQATASLIDEVIHFDYEMNAHWIALSTPYDNYSSYNLCTVTPGYMEKFVNAARSNGLGVWFRSQWNSWQGDYNFQMLTFDTTPALPYETAGGIEAVLNGTDNYSYLAKTYHWILENPTLFKDGDIFTPAAEPENAGIYPFCNPPCQFPNASEFSRWIGDNMILDRMAFEKIGVNVSVGFWGIGCDAPYNLENSTEEEMEIFATDCYFANVTQVVDHLESTSEAMLGIPVVLGEWGDIWDDGEEPIMSIRLHLLLYLLSSWNYTQEFLGLNYWRDVGESGGEGVLWPIGNLHTSYYINEAGYILQHWYRGNEKQVVCPIPNLGEKSASFYVETRWDNGPVSNGKQVLQYEGVSVSFATSILSKNVNLVIYLLDALVLIYINC